VTIESELRLALTLALSLRIGKEQIAVLGKPLNSDRFPVLMKFLPLLGERAG